MTAPLAPLPSLRPSAPPVDLQSLQVTYILEAMAGAKQAEATPSTSNNPTHQHE